MCDLKGTLMPVVNGAHLEDAISGQIFFTADRAMKHFQAVAKAEAKAAAEAAETSADPVGADAEGSAPIAKVAP